MVPDVRSPDREVRPRAGARRQPLSPLASSADIRDPSSDEVAESNASQNIARPRPALPAVPSTVFPEKKTERAAMPVDRAQQPPARVEAIETIIEKEVRVSRTTTRNAPKEESPDRTRPSFQTSAPPGPPAPRPSVSQSPTREAGERRTSLRLPEREIPNLRDHKSRKTSSKPLEPALKPVAGSVPRAAPSTPPPIVPEIRVTIGRLEIHAATAGPRPLRAKSVGPRLSLEAYLRSRNGGNKE